MSRDSVSGEACTARSAARAAGAIASAAVTSIRTRIAETIGPRLRTWGYGFVAADRPALRWRRARDRRLPRRHRRRPGALRLRAVLDPRRARGGCARARRGS